MSAAALNHGGGLMHDKLQLTPSRSASLTRGSETDGVHYAAESRYEDGAVTVPQRAEPEAAPCCSFRR